MILLHRKVLPRPGRPTRMMISFCLSTRFLFRIFPGPFLQRNVLPPDAAVNAYL